MSHKNLILIALLAVAVLAGGAFWLGREKTEPTAVESKKEQVSIENGKKELQPTLNTFEDFFATAEPMKVSFPDMDTSKWTRYRDEKMGFTTKIPQDWMETIESSENMACKKDGEYYPREIGKECQVSSWLTSCIGTRGGYYTQEEGAECPIQISKWPDALIDNLKSLKENDSNIFYKLEVNGLKILVVLVSDSTDRDHVYFQQGDSFWEMGYDQSVVRINQALSGFIRNLSFEK